MKKNINQKKYDKEITKKALKTKEKNRRLREETRERWNEPIYDSEGMLKFCLMLEEYGSATVEAVSGSDISSLRDWINRCYMITEKSCFSICNPLGILFNNKNTDKTEIELQTDYAMLEFDTGFWNFVFRQDVILSAYDKVRKLLARRNPLSSTEFSKLLAPYYITEKNGKTANKFDVSIRCGLWYLINKYTISDSGNKFLSLKNGDLSIQHPRTSKKEDTFNPYSDSYFISYASNKTDKVREIYNSVSNFTYLKDFSCFGDEDAEHFSIMQYNSLELFSHLDGSWKIMNADNTISKTGGGRSIKALTAAHSSNIFGRNQYVNYIKCYKEMLSDLPLSTISDFSKTSQRYELADQVYCRYQLEKLFSGEIIDCIYHNIDRSPYKNELTADMSLIGMCSLLPNVFTRHLILQMGFDSRAHVMREIREKDSSVAYRMQELETGQVSEEWRKRFRSSMSLLSKFIFPIYENYFFITLWKSIRATTGTDDECLSKLFCILSEYLNDPNEVEELITIPSYFREIDDTARATSQYLSYKYDEDKLIKPVFTSKINDYALYHECILSVNNQRTSENYIPAFINRNYLERISPGIIRNIQSIIFESVKKA